MTLKRIEKWGFYADRALLGSIKFLFSGCWWDNFRVADHTEVTVVNGFSLTTHPLVSRFTIRLGPAAKTDDPTQALINISTHETAHDVPDHVDDSHDIMTPGQVGGADLYHRASRTRRKRS